MYRFSFDCSTARICNVKLNVKVSWVFTPRIQDWNSGGQRPVVLLISWGPGVSRTWDSARLISQTLFKYLTNYRNETSGDIPPINHPVPPNYPNIVTPSMHPLNGTTRMAPPLGPERNNSENATSAAHAQRPLLVTEGSLHTASI
jgi:hypothetical protein